jgi:hypothetical protein
LLLFFGLLFRLMAGHLLEFFGGTPAPHCVDCARGVRGRAVCGTGAFFRRSVRPVHGREDGFRHDFPECALFLWLSSIPLAHPQPPASTAMGGAGLLRRGVFKATVQLGTKGADLRMDPGSGPGGRYAFRLAPSA